MFDLIDNPDALPAPYAKTLHELGEQAQGNAGRRFWESLESAHLKKMADALRKDELRAPIAGVSHWRREPEFCAAQAATGPGPDRRPAVLGPLAVGLARDPLDALVATRERPGGQRQPEASRGPSLRARPVVQPEHAGVVLPP